MEVLSHIMPFDLDLRNLLNMQSSFITRKTPLTPVAKDMFLGRIIPETLLRRHNRGLMRRAIIERPGGNRTLIPVLLTNKRIKIVVAAQFPALARRLRV
jgi:hypothetical protein